MSEVEPKVEISKAEQLAREHWEWLQGLLEKVYVDAFVHGFKHGKEDR